MARERSPRTLRKFNLYGWPQRGPGADADDYPEVDAWPALQLRVGTSGWAYPHWKGRFYPEKQPPAHHLAWYSRRLPTIEVNSTYYRMPTAETFVKWRDTVPPGFQFTIKSPGSITHEKRLVDIDAELDEFLTRTRLLGDKLGLLLFQFPPGFKADLALLSAFLDKLPRDTRIALELRHRSWYERNVYMLLAHHERAFVVHDHNKKGTPLVETAPFVYLRLHGPSGRYRGQYDWETMFQWAMQTREWMERGFEVYTYFNNDERAKATLNIPAYRELATGRAEPREAKTRHEHGTSGASA